MIYPINHLPEVIPVGVQTEQGVEVIGFDLKPWLDALPDMDFSVWHTRPGENEAYPVNDHMMIGTVLYWHPDGYDTALDGGGRVEIAGVGDNQRKLSGFVATSIRATSLGATKEPGENAAPWYEAVLQAAQDVKADVDVGTGGLFLVNVKNSKADRTQDEIRAAVAAGKTCLLTDDFGMGYTYYEETTYPSDPSETRCPTFTRYERTPDGIAQYEARVLSTGEVIVGWFNGLCATPNPWHLVFDGLGLSYNGSKQVRVKIPVIADPADKKSAAYLRWNGTGYAPATVDSVKAELGAGGTVEVDATLTKANTAADAKVVGDRFTSLSDEMAALKGEGGTEITELDIELSSGYFYRVTSGVTNIYDKKIENASSVYTPEAVDLGMSSVGAKLQILASKYGGTASERCTGFCDANGKPASFVQERNLFVYDESAGYYIAELDIVARYLYISLANTTSIIGVRIIKESATYIGDSAYVSVDGSDADGTGAKGSPFATVSKALKAGCTDIVVKGGVYKQRIIIDVNDRIHDGKMVTISPADPDGRVIFVDPDATIATAETIVSGYTKVYSAATNKTFADNNVWIFQDGIPDATTLITDAERHPLERGQEYRCEDTKIERCTATALTDALVEIEAADTYKWYIESGTIYFSRPQAITADNPLCGSFGAKLFDGFASRARTIELVGIESKYMMFNVGGMSRATLKDCKSVNVYGAGAFTYDQSASIEFIRCEAARCFYGGLGDGFNGHATNTGDPFSKQTTALFVDCWSHDNSDDGYSDHERSETTIIGGLYEYNGKAGVTPAGGSHCTCYNVISRNNYCGFFYTNGAAAEEGGKGGQMMCIGCVAENNTRGGTKTGFRVTTAGNTAILIGCKSIGHDVGYASGTDTQMRLVDCGSLNDATVKSGSGIVIENTTLVS